MTDSWFILQAYRRREAWDLIQREFIKELEGSKNAR